ncbi:MAG: DUF4783 domain-containing protein [Flavobacteriia bacterium]|nr:DUF4783 domain-containing protein [Flavobacteriia bacterium]
MIFSLLFTFFVFLQPTANPPYPAIEQAFNQKNTENLSKLCQDNLLYSFLGKENIYSQAQLQMILKEFFKDRKSHEFKFTFKSKEQSNESYGIATFSNKNEQLRITLYIKKLEKGYKIYRIIIEK